ncbi:hypothetical protein [Streptomyces sp. NPDC003697]
MRGIGAPGGAFAHEPGLLGPGRRGGVFDVCTAAHRLGCLPVAGGGEELQHAQGGKLDR